MRYTVSQGELLRLGTSDGIITIHESSFFWLLPAFGLFCLTFADSKCFGGSDILVTVVAILGAWAFLGNRRHWQFLYTNL